MISDSVASAELIRPSPQHQAAGANSELALGGPEACATSLSQPDISLIVAELQDSQEQYIQLKQSIEGLKVSQTVLNCISSLKARVMMIPHFYTDIEYF